MTDDFIEVLGVAICLPMLAGGAVLIGQIGWFLYSGHWVPLSAIDAIQFANKYIEWNVLEQWAISPGTWVGIHKLLAGTSASFFLVLITIILFFFTITIANIATKR